MPKGTKSMATEAALEAMDMVAEAKEEIRKNYGHSVGYEEMSRKEIRALIRKGLEGDAQARAEVNKLHQTNQYPDGRNPVQDEINLILAERTDSVLANITEKQPEEGLQIEDIIEGAEPGGERKIEDILGSV